MNGLYMGGESICEAHERQDHYKILYGKILITK